MDRSTFEDDIYSIRLEFIDKSLELSEEVEDHRRRTHLESAASSVALVHKVDAENGHVFILPLSAPHLHAAYSLIFNNKLSQELIA